MAQLRNVPAGCLSPFLNDSTPGFGKFNPEPTGQEQREPQLKIAYTFSVHPQDLIFVPGWRFPGHGVNVVFLHPSSPFLPSFPDGSGCAESF